MFAISPEFNYSISQFFGGGSKKYVLLFSMQEGYRMILEMEKNPSYITLVYYLNC